MDAASTGNDVARLLQVVYARGFTFGAVDLLDLPYRIDRDARCIYLAGRLPVLEYFAALAEALAELDTDGLVVLHPRPVGVHCRSG
jgi:hypothetical protein